MSQHDILTVQMGNEVPASTQQRTDALLTLLLESLISKFDRYIQREDLLVLYSSLSHLFVTIHRLFDQTLPSLARSQQHASLDSEQATLQYEQQIWRHLREIRTALERIESLCHLLDNIITAMLELIEQQSSPLAMLNTPPLFPPLPPSTETGQQNDNATDQLQEMLRMMLDLAPEQLSPTPPAFGELFAHLPSLHLNLVLIDSALASLYDSSARIFNSILPDSVTSPVHNILASYTTLLDLLQQTDLLLHHIDILLDPLQHLIRQYALNVDIH